MQPIKDETQKKPLDKKALTYQRDKDREKVKGIFRNFETRGGSIKFPFRGYKGDPIEWYELTDGKTYEIPLGVAKHLNKNCWVPEYQHLGDDTFRGAIRGTGKMSVLSKKKRFGFQSLEFIDTEDLTMEGRPMNEVVGVKFQ